MVVGKLEPAADISWRDIKDELVVLNTHSGEYFVFNDTGRTIWFAIIEGKSEDDIAKQIVREYDVKSEADVYEDIRTFVDKALKNNLLICR